MFQARKEIIDCECLVVGSGPGGAVTAKLLAENGLDVVVVEEGPFFQSKDFSPDIGKMTKLLYRNGGVFPIVGNPTMAYGEGCCVGGGSTINGGLIWRTPPWILELWEKKHGISGFNVEALKVHFETIERDLSVTRHNLSKKNNLDSLLLHNAAISLGWKSVTVPRAIKNCTNENYCPTGCMTDAKQSMLNTYIPKAIDSGARLISGFRVKHIFSNGNHATAVLAQSRHEPSHQITITFKRLFLAGGAIQTPFLLRKSKINKSAGKDLRFHFNLKFVALFDKDINASNGTIFTTQIQEFERDGILICPSTLSPTYIAMTLSQFNNSEIDRVLDKFQQAGIFVAMTKPVSTGRIESFGNEPFVWYQFNNKDMPDILFAITKTTQVLFEAGARVVYLPIKGCKPVKSIHELNTYLKSIKPSKLELITVHTMASCPMGIDPKCSVVDCNGKVYGSKNVFVSDASVLPGNVGESPQGTLMAFAHEILSRLIH